MIVVLLLLVAVQDNAAKAQSGDGPAPKPHAPSTVDLGIHGFVFGKDVSTDNSGHSRIEDLGPLPGAKIELQYEGGLRIGSTTTDDSGFYSFPSLRDGTIEYQVTAEGFQPEDDHRAFQLTDEKQSRVVNFTLITGDSQNSAVSRAQLTVKVTAFKDGSRQAVQSATILFWQPGREEDKITVEAPHGETPDPIQLAPGEWTVMSRSGEFGLSSSTTMTLVSGQRTDIDIFYPEAIRDIRALVKVSGPNARAAGKPTVQFVKTSDTGHPVPTVVEALSDEELAAISGQDSPNRWYWATPAQYLHAGQEYLATGDISGFASANSSAHVVDATGVRIFNITLLRDQQLSSISGLVELDEKGVRSPIPGANVHFENETSGVVAEFVTDSAGRYEGKIPDGNWWGNIESVPDDPTIATTEPLRTIVPQSGTAEMNFLVARSSSSGANLIRALVNIQASATPSTAIPTVTFVKANGERLPTSVSSPTAEEIRQLGLGTDGSETRWFWADPVNKLPTPGTFRAESSLTGYFNDATLDQVVTETDVKIFHLTLRPQVQFGRLAGYVRDRDTGDIIDGAWVGIGEVESLVTDARGVYGPANLQAGTYAVYVSAGQEYFGTTVSVTMPSGKNIQRDIKLQRKPIMFKTDAFANVIVSKIPGCEPQQPPSVVFAPNTGPTSGGQNTMVSVPAVLTLQSSSRFTEFYIAHPVQPLAPGSYQATASLPLYSTQTTNNLSVVPNRPTIFNLKLEKDPAPVAVIPYAWRETPEDQRKLAQVRGLRDPNAIRNLRQQSLSGVEVLMWPEKSTVRGSIRIPVKSPSLLEPGYWWYVPLTTGPSTARFQPQRILVPCKGLKFDFAVPEKQRDCGTALIIVRTQHCQTPSPNVGAAIASNPAVFVAQRPRINQPSLSVVLKSVDGGPAFPADLVYADDSNQAESVYWYRVADCLPAGNYTAFATREADGAEDTTTQYVASGPATTFHLSLECRQLTPEPNQLVVNVTTSTPPDSQVVLLVAAKSAIGEIRRLFRADTQGGFGSDKDIGFGKYSAAGLPPGEWTVKVAEAPGPGLPRYQPASHPWPIRLTSGDTEMVEVTLERLPQPEEYADVDAIVRVERPKGASRVVHQPSVSFRSIAASAQLSQSLDRQPAGVSLQNATVSPASDSLLESLGQQREKFPNSDWFIAKPAGRIEPGTISASAKLGGYQGDSETRPALPQLATHLLLELVPHRPTLRVLVRNASDGLPVSGVEVSLQPPRSATFEYRETTGPNGALEFTLEHGIDDYQVRLSGSALDKEQLTSISVVEGINEETFEVFLQGEERTAIVFGSVRPADGTGPSSLREPIAGVTVSLEPIGGIVLPNTVKTSVQTTAQGFEFRGLPAGKYRLTASNADFRDVTLEVSVDVNDDDNRTGPIDLMLSPCNYEYDNFLVAILNGSFADAQKNYQAATQLDPRDLRAHYAFALTALQNKRYSTAKKSLLEVLKQPSREALWDRATEAYIWTDLQLGKRNSVEDAIDNIRKLAANHYGTRTPTRGSQDTAGLMGVGAAMVEQPWQDMKIREGTGLADRISSDLSPPHAASMQAEHNRALERYRQLKKQLDDSLEADKARGAELAAENRQRIENEIESLRGELAQIEADVANKRAEGDRICSDVLVQVRPLEADWQVKNGQLQIYTQQLNDLLNQLNNLPPVNVGGQGGGGLNGGGGFGGNGGAGASLNKPSDSPYVKKLDTTALIPDSVLGQLGGQAQDPIREQLQRQILSLRQQINVLQQVMRQLELQVNNIKQRCVVATNLFNTFLRQGTFRANQIKSQITSLEQELAANNPEDHKSEESKKREDDLQKLETYYIFPFDARKEEILDGLCVSKRYF